MVSIFRAVGECGGGAPLGFAGICGAGAESAPLSKFPLKNDAAAPT